ncbi:MAG: bifunctional folylpolyglutamate synthase/dihydrofolate synthase [Firmicutes bacterium]|nr:bifunctional folylpolyglutamate synthase/dihydrofolate synthase [Bacillota bacterium]
MTYKEALEYIHGTRKFGCKLGLENIKTLLGMLGNPHEKLKYVHVAGTNGKGSTVAFIGSILIESGYKTGIYISPYIERFTERIQVNRKEISEHDLARITEIVKGKVDEMLRSGLTHPTEFEIVTAIGFQYYCEMECDIVVLEVGLGGRFDSTNVINTPLVSVITSISYDHMDILGNTLAQIAFEKAGIIKEGGDVVLYSQDEEVEKVIENVCNERNSRLHRADFGKIKALGHDIEGQTFDFGPYKNLKIKLLGGHQLKNAAVAVEACKVLANKGYKITEETIRKGLERASWPGRMEVVSKNPLFFIDGAHNIEGVRVLAEYLTTYFPDKKKIFIMGVLRDKEYKAMLEIIAPLADKFITVTPLSERALPAAELAENIRAYCKNVLISDTIESGIKTALQIYSGDDIICAFGSLYYIGEIRRYFENLRSSAFS